MPFLVLTAEQPSYTLVLRAMQERNDQEVARIHVFNQHILPNSAFVLHEGQDYVVTSHSMSTEAGGPDVTVTAYRR